MDSAGPKRYCQRSQPKASFDETLLDDDSLCRLGCLSLVVSALDDSNPSAAPTSCILLSTNAQASVSGSSSFFSSATVSGGDPIFFFETLILDCASSTEFKNDKSLFVLSSFIVSKPVISVNEVVSS